MGKASISIDITSNFNGSGVSRAIEKMNTLAQRAVAFNGTVGNGFVQAGWDADYLGTKIQNVGKGMQKLGARLTQDVTLPIVGFGTASVLAATKVDTAFYGVRKTVDMTEQEYQRLYNATMKMSTVQPVSAETLFNIQELGGQLGVSNAALLDFSDTISKIDVATNIDAETAALQLAQFANVTNMAESNYSNFAATLVGLGNNVAAQESTIMNLGLRFASAGAQAGMSQAEILGMSAALASLGMNAESGGSALSQVINNINKNVQKGADHVENFAKVAGMSAQEFADAWKNNAADTFSKVVVGLAQDSEHASVVLEELGISSIRQSDAMRRLASDTELLPNTIKLATQAWEENNAHIEEFTKRSESIQSRFDVLKNKVTAALVNFGKPIAEALLTAADNAMPLLEVISNIAQAFSDASPATQQFVVGLAGIAAAAGPVLSITGRFVENIGGVVKGVGHAASSMGVLAEAYYTTDGAMIRNLAQNKAWTVQMGLSRNETIKAAGGLDAYIEKADKYIHNQKAAAEATARDRITAEYAAEAKANYARATEELATAQERSQKATERSSRAKSDARVASNNLRSAESKLSTAQREYAEAQDAASIKYKDNAQGKEAAQRASKNLEEAERKLTRATKNRESALAAANKASDAASRASDREKASSDALKKAKEAEKSAYKEVEASKQGFVSNSKNVAAVNKEVAAAQNQANAALKNGTADLSGYASTVSQTTGIMGKLSNAAQVVGGAFMALAPTLAITGAITAISVAVGALISHFEEVARKQEEWKQSTTGLADASEQFKNAIYATNDAMVASLTASTDYEEIIENGVQRRIALADSIRDTTASVEEEAAILNYAKGVIREYYGETELNVAEQAKLKTALELVADAFEEVAINADGDLYNTQTNEIYNTVAAIETLIDAKKREAQVEAAKSLYVEALKEEITSKRELDKAQSEYNQKIEEQAYWQEEAKNATDANMQLRYNDYAEECGREAGTLKERVEELTEAWETNSEVTKDFEAILGEKMAEAGEAVQAFAQKLEESLGEEKWGAVKSGLESTGRTTEEFSRALMEVGVSFDQLSVLGPEALGNLATSFDGSKESIINSILSLRDNGTNAFSEMATAWQSSLDDGMAKAVSIVANGTDDTVESLFATVVKYGEAGRESVLAYANALESGKSPSEASKEAFSKIVEAVESTKGEVEQGAESIAQSLTSPFQQINFAETINGQLAPVPGLVQASMSETTGIITTNTGQWVQAIATFEPNRVLSDKWGTANNTISTEGSKAVSTTAQTVTGMNSAFSDNLNFNVPVSNAFFQVGTQTAASQGAGTSQSTAFSNAFSQYLATAPLMDGFQTAMSLGLSTAQQQIITEAQAMGTQAMVSLAEGFRAYDTEGIGKEMASKIVTGLGTEDWGAAAQPIVDGVNNKIAETDFTATGRMVGEGIASGFEASGMAERVGAHMEMTKAAIEMAFTAISVTALTHGMQTGMAYAAGLGITAGMAQAQAQAAGTATGAAFSSGVGTATAAGIATGAGYSAGIMASTGAGAGAARAAVSAVIAAYTSGAGRARSAGNSTGNGYATGIRSGAGPARSAAMQQVQQVLNAYQSGIGQAQARGTQVGISFVRGVTSQAGAAYSGGKALVNAANSGMSAIGNTGFSYGASMGENLARGIRSKVSAVQAAAAALASAAAAPLHHSTPKVGPLRGDDKWGGHLVDNIVHGMKSKEALLRTEAQTIAGIAAEANPPAIHDFAAVEAISGSAEDTGGRFFRQGTITQALSRTQAAVKDVQKQVSRGTQGEVYNFYFDGVKLNDDEDIRRVATDLLVRLKTLSEM